MTFDDYQKQSRETAIYPHLDDNLPYLALGLTGEAGEVSERVKKYIRDERFGGITTLQTEQKELLANDIGDVLWYIAQVATELGYSLQDIASMNIAKTNSDQHKDKLANDEEL